MVPQDPVHGVLKVTVPPVVTVTETGKVVRSNVAVTDFAASIVTSHVPVPLHQEPVQPVNVEPADADGVSTTTASRR